MDLGYDADAYCQNLNSALDHAISCCACAHYLYSIEPSCPQAICEPSVTIQFATPQLDQQNNQQIIEETISAPPIIKVLSIPCKPSCQPMANCCVHPFGRMNLVWCLSAPLIKFLCEVHYPCEVEENPKFNAEIVFATNAASIAQDLPDIPETSTIVSGGTSPIIIPSIDSSLLESGGAYLISTQELLAPSDGTSTTLSIQMLDSMPPFFDPTSTSGGTSAGAPSADYQSIICFPDNMPLLPPRTVIGVQDTVPPRRLCHRFFRFRIICLLGQRREKLQQP